MQETEKHHEMVCIPYAKYNGIDLDMIAPPLGLKELFKEAKMESHQPHRIEYVNADCNCLFCPTRTHSETIYTPPVSTAMPDHFDITSVVSDTETISALPPLAPSPATSTPSPAKPDLQFPALHPPLLPVPPPLPTLLQHTALPQIDLQRAVRIVETGRSNLSFRAKSYLIQLFQNEFNLKVFLALSPGRLRVEWCDFKVARWRKG